MEWLAVHSGSIIHVIRLLVCVMCFIMLAVFSSTAWRDKYSMIKNTIESSVMNVMQRNKNTRSMFSYEYCKERLDRSGVTYYSRGHVTPLVYLVYKVGCIIAGIVLTFTSGITGILLAVAAYVIPDYLAKSRNTHDNRQMLGGIMDVYDVILLQVNSGEYITKILVDAYMVAKHPRLKAALMELTGDIIVSNDLAASMELFGKKFDNDNINNLVVLVKQLADTGVSEDMIKDIRNYLAILQENYNKYEQDSIEHKCSACTIAVFICLVGFILFACVIDVADIYKSITI